MNGGIISVLLEQKAENLPSLLRLARSNEGRAPGEEKARVVGRGL